MAKAYGGLQERPGMASEMVPRMYSPSGTLFPAMMWG